jgi:hypothetical protein
MAPRTVKLVCASTVSALVIGAGATPAIASHHRPTDRAGTPAGISGDEQAGARTAGGGYADANGDGNGNRGAVWLTGADGSAPGHEPHLDCDDFLLWGAGLASGKGTYAIAAWPPTGERTTLESGAWAAPHDGGREAAVIANIDGEALAEAAHAAGATPHPEQGYHMKLLLSQAAGGKNKTFWLDCAGEAAAEAAAAPAASVPTEISSQTLTGAAAPLVAPTPLAPAPVVPAPQPEAEVAAAGTATAAADEIVVPPAELAAPADPDDAEVLALQLNRDEGALASTGGPWAALLALSAALIGAGLTLTRVRPRRRPGPDPHGS